MTVLGLLFW